VLHIATHDSEFCLLCEPVPLSLSHNRRETVVTFFRSDRDCILLYATTTAVGLLCHNHATDFVDLRRRSVHL